jgi:hypothetical protein
MQAFPDRPVSATTGEVNRRSRHPRNRRARRAARELRAPAERVRLAPAEPIAGEPARPPLDWSRLRRRLVSAFVAFNIVAIVCWSLPGPKVLLDGINAVTGPYVRCIGLWQSWKMFAPDPRSVLVRVDATVTLFDGTERTWRFVPPAESGILQRLRRQRLRKWANDHVRVNVKRGLWAPAARFAARQFDDRENPPLSVKLHRHWLPVPDPWEKVERKTGWRHATYFETSVTQGPP